MSGLMSKLRVTAVLQELDERPASSPTAPPPRMPAASASVRNEGAVSMRVPRRRLALDASGGPPGRASRSTQRAVR